MNEDKEICLYCHSFSRRKRTDIGWCMKLRTQMGKNDSCLNYN